MHARGFLIDVFRGGKDELPTDEEQILRLAADSLDWYAEEGYGIGDVEMSDGENLNACCEGYILGERARFQFSDGTCIKEIDDAIKDIEDSGVGVGLVVCNAFCGWMEEGLDFCEGDALDIIYENAEEMKHEYSMEIEDGGCIVGILFDARTYC